MCDTVDEVLDSSLNSSSLRHNIKAKNTQYSNPFTSAAEERSFENVVLLAIMKKI